MPADFNTPVIASAHATYLANLKERDTDALTLCYAGDPSNTPTGAIKYLRASDKFQEWSGAAWVDKVLSIAGGGTGASTAATARTALGLGTMATQNANAVAITGGTIAGVAANANIITAGLIAQARLGTGSGGAGLKFLADDQTYKDGVPVGLGFIWFTNVAPTGYLICDGSSVAVATYAALFAVIGYVFGGAGANFNLPDFRQRFAIGKAAAGTANTLAGTGGNIDHTHAPGNHTHTYTDVINHTHPITDPGHGHVMNVYASSGFGSQALQSNGGSNGAMSPAITPNTTGITATNNPSGGVATGTTSVPSAVNTGQANPPFLVINYIVKY